jgi:hypothetical protein
MEDRWTSRGSGAADRLASLRAAELSGPDTEKTSLRKGLTKEILLGVVLLLVGVLSGLMFLSRESSPATGDTAPVVAEIPDQVLSTGEFLVAALVEPGDFPPGMVSGERVRVVVSTHQSGEDPPRMLPGEAAVSAVDTAGDMSSSTVVTLRTAEDMAREVAAAERVRLVIVGTEA